MATAKVSKPRKPVQQPLNPIDPPEPADDDLSFTPDDISVTDLLSELGDTAAVIRIYRQGRTARELTLIDEMPVSAFTPMMLAFPPYDGGTFRIHARSDTGIVANRSLTVQGRPKIETVAAPNTVMSQQQIIDTVIAALRATVPAVPAPDPMAQMKMMLDMMTPLLVRPEPAPAPAPAGGLLDDIGKLKAMLDIAKLLNPAPVVVNSDGQPDVTGTLLTKGMEMFTEAMKNNRSGAQLAPQDNPAPALSAPAAPAGSPDSEEIMASKILLQFALNKACRAAAAGIPPEEHAELVYDDIPDDVLSSMKNDPQWFAPIVAIAPACAQHQAWFSQVRDALIRFWDEDNVSENPPEVPPGALANNLTPPAAADIRPDGDFLPDTGTPGQT